MCTSSLPNFGRTKYFLCREMRSSEHWIIYSIAYTSNLPGSKWNTKVARCCFQRCAFLFLILCFITRFFILNLKCKQTNKQGKVGQNTSTDYMLKSASINYWKKPCKKNTRVKRKRDGACVVCFIVFFMRLCRSIFVYQSMMVLP